MMNCRWSVHGEENLLKTAKHLIVTDHRAVAIDDDN